MNEFLELVTQRPDLKLWKKGTFCPYCQSKNVRNFGTTSTLVGYSGEDMNHRCTECHCDDCHKDFTIESKGPRNVWFTDSNGKVLLGIPRCFESYVYTCKHCGGDVHRKYYDIKDDKELINTGLVYSMIDGKMTAQQYPVYVCSKCGEKIRSTNEYYSDYAQSEGDSK